MPWIEDVGSLCPPDRILVGVHLKQVLPLIVAFDVFVALVDVVASKQSLQVFNAILSVQVDVYQKLALLCVLLTQPLRPETQGVVRPQAPGPAAAFIAIDLLAETTVVGETSVQVPWVPRI